MKKLVPVKSLITRACVGWLVLFSLFGQTFAQQTAADTQIQNQASATYSDGNGNNFSAVSNIVTITVAKVAGLAITPDGQTNSSVVPGQSNVTFTFRVTNTGNFTDQARFLANGGSIRVVGPAVATAATISGSGANILTNSADVLQSLTQNGFVDVVVTATINSNATPGSGVQIFLGDATTGTNFDNVAANNSANEVRTVSTGAVNGSREARGDISVTVDNDGLLRAVMSVPPGPVALGSNIQYTVSACNDGQRALNPLSGDSSIYMFIPVPLGATLTTGQTYPAGTQFTTSPLSALPTAASWSGTAPGTLSSVTRIRIPLAD